MRAETGLTQSRTPRTMRRRAGAGTDVIGSRRGATQRDGHQDDAMLNGGPGFTEPRWLLFSGSWVSFLQAMLSQLLGDEEKRRRRRGKRC